MEPSVFDEITRWLAKAFPRRMVFGFGGVAVGLAAPGRSLDVHAKKRKQPSFNAFGCLDVGAQCRGNSANCCSGICEGKKPKKGKKDKSRCVGHNVDVCLQGQGSVKCSGTDGICTLPDGGGGMCETTTGNAGYCVGSSIVCLICGKDTDCAPLCGADAACVQCVGCAEGTACVGSDSLSCVP